MRIAFAVLALVLLVWTEPASAQDTPIAEDMPRTQDVPIAPDPPKMYSVSVSRHADLVQEGLTESDVNAILEKASSLLKRKGCNVEFTLKGPIGTFGPNQTPAVVSKEHIDAAHRIDSEVGSDIHVKLVSKVTEFCRFPGRGFRGCAFPTTFRSLIIVHPKKHTDGQGHPIANFPDHRLWAHEFGHLTGLGHRADPRALMTPCDLHQQFFWFPDDAQIQVTAEECSCLRFGPGFGPNGTCPLPSVACPW